MNALSEKLDLKIYRDNKEYFVSFKNGNTIKPLKKIGNTKKKGTSVTFLPAKEIFSSIKFSSSVLQKRMRELAFLNKGLTINLTDNTGTKKKEFNNKYEGESEFVKYINTKKPILTNKNEKHSFLKNPIYVSSG